MLYRTDYHIHSEYSDGKASPEKYIDAALYAGMNEIGFAEHLNILFNDLTWCIDHKKIPEYIGHISRLSNSYENIIIKTGFEVDYFPGRKKEIHDFLSPLKIDYVIGSVHYMGDVTVDSSEEFYNGKDFNELLFMYFEIVCEAVSSGLFDIIGHCDLIRIFGHQYNGNPEYLYRHLALNMAKYNVALEINTNGKNRPLGEFYPDVRFLHLFREANVPVCVNSDAHLPARVGENFDEAYKLLKDAGYGEMCTFNGRSRKMVPFAL